MAILATPPAGGEGMKIAFFTDTFSPTINGVVTSIIYFANELTKQGHQVLIIAPKHSPRDASWGLDRKVKVFLVRSVDGKVYPDTRVGIPTLMCWKAVHSFHPDVVHTFTPLSIGISGSLIARVLKVPSVAFHMTNYTDDQAQKALRQFPQFFLKSVQYGAGTAIRWILNSHDAVCVPSQDTHQDLLDHKVSVPIWQVPLPIDIQALQAGKDMGKKLRQKMEIKVGILYAGRLSGEKNVDRILEVFARLLPSHPECKLILIGDGPERQHLMEIATQKEINQAIIWFGAVPHSQLVEEGYYYLGDVFITLSEFETQGLSTVEAMACGLFPVGAKARATREILAEFGSLVDPTEHAKVATSIEQFFALPAKEKKDLQTKAQAIAQQFDKTATVQKLIACYESVL